MLEMESLTTFLAIEAVVILALALAFVIVGISRKERRGRDQASQLVDRLNDDEDAHLANLTADLSESGALLPADERRHAIEAVNQREKALYRHVIEAFLNHDVNQLHEIDRYVRGIAEPYCQLIRDLIRRGAESEPAAQQVRIDTLQERLEEAQTENDLLRQQLREALQTLDEVTQEYARMFGDRHQAGDDLAASRARMLAHFRKAAGLNADGGNAVNTPPKRVRS